MKSTRIIQKTDTTLVGRGGQLRDEINKLMKEWEQGKINENVTHWRLEFEVDKK